MKLNQRKSRLHRSRRGIAAVETALMLPLLVIVTFGSIDVAQYINLGQVVCNASREGARIASRDETLTVSEVETGVTDFIASAFPNLSDADLKLAVSVNITKHITSSGDDEDSTDDSSIIESGQLDNVGSGNPISVEVEFDFDQIRWLSGITVTAPASTTTCRRD